jgi:hypothetical protein
MSAGASLAADRPDDSHGSEVTSIVYDREGELWLRKKTWFGQTRSVHAAI